MERKSRLSDMVGIPAGWVHLTTRLINCELTIHRFRCGFRNRSGETATMSCGAASGIMIAYERSMNRIRDLRAGATMSEQSSSADMELVPGLIGRARGAGVRTQRGPARGQTQHAVDDPGDGASFAAGCSGAAFRPSNPRWDLRSTYAMLPARTSALLLSPSPNWNESTAGGSTSKWRPLMATALSGWERTGGPSSHYRRRPPTGAAATTAIPTNCEACRWRGGSFPRPRRHADPKEEPALTNRQRRFLRERLGATSRCTLRFYKLNCGSR